MRSALVGTVALFLLPLLVLGAVVGCLCWHLNLGFDTAWELLDKGAHE